MPARKPARLKLLSGRGPGKDSAGRPVKVGPAYVRSAPSPPTLLDREAAAEWRRVVPELERLRLLSRVTRSSLAAYCLAWSRFAEATRLVHRDGLVRDGRAHPAVAIQRDAGAELRRWASQFGLTPASEQQVASAPVDDDDAIS